MSTVKPAILHLRDSKTPGSPEKLIWIQAGGLRDRYSFHMLFYHHEWAGFCREMDAPFERIHIQPVLGMRFAGFTGRLKEILRENRIDLVVSHDYKSNWISAGLKNSFPRLPRISIFHGWTSHNVRIRLIQRIDAMLLNTFDKVVAVSDASKSLLVKRGVRAKVIDVVPNAIDPAQYVSRGGTGLRKEFGIDRDVCLVAAAGRLSREKGFHHFIEAIHILVNRSNMKIKGVIFGDGEEGEHLRTYALKLGIRDHIVFAGYRDNFAELVRDADLFVIPSLTEGLPLVLLEAFLGKKPVVATSVGGIPEAICHGKNGYLVEPGDSAELAGRIRACMDNPEEISEVAENGYRTLVEKYSPGKYCDRFDRIYRQYLHQVGQK